MNLTKKTFVSLIKKEVSKKDRDKDAVLAIIYDNYRMYSHIDVVLGEPEDKIVYISTFVTDIALADKDLTVADIINTLDKFDDDTVVSFEFMDEINNEFICTLPSKDNVSFDVQDDFVNIEVYNK